MEINNNIPNYNFITSLIREKNNNIKENILLGNIHFPEMLLYSPKSLFESESHAIFLNKLSNKLSLEKIKEEKNFLNKKIEMTNNKIDNIKNYINKEAVKRNYNDLLPPLNFSNILPIIKEKKEKHEKNKKSKEKFNKNKLLMEIKPLPSKRSNQILIDKRLSKEKEYDLEQNAKEFIRKINNYKINNINIRKQKQKLDFLRLQREIEIAERKKQKEEYDLIQKREELKQNILRQQNLYSNYNNEISPQKVKRKRYHYYNPQSSSRKKNKMMKNFSYVLYNNINNDYNNNIHFYNNLNNLNNINNMIGGYYLHPNVNPYQQMINNDRDRRNTENTGTLNAENNGMVYKESNNHSLINESRNNNNYSILNTSEKKHLYYFNDLKYENEK